MNILKIASQSKTISLSLFFCVSILLLAPTGGVGQVVIKGKIFDKSTGETMIGATVILKGTTTGTTTDIDGKFEFSIPQSYPFTLVVSYLGYITQEFEVASAKDNLNFKLPTDEVMLESVVIADTRITEKQKESPLTIESMDIIAIKETPAANFYDGLGALKGVDLTSASIGFKIINTRGFNSTSPVRSLQIIDGVDNQSPGLNFSLGNFLGASELDVMKVELIAGASSAFFGPNAFNGVISITSKNPFQFPGLSVMAKVGERNLLETSIRYAQVFKNKKGEDKFAYKFNIFFMRADDWIANNMDTASGSVVDTTNPGGYDAVNRYGDEILDRTTDLRDEEFASYPGFPGLGIWHRNGYREEDLVDYNSRNIKLGAAFHYKLKPDVELIYASNFGTGTTVYQGDNRYNLKNVLFFQNRLELRKKDKYFLRAYATNEDAGKSFDAVFTAFLLQDAAKDNSTDPNQLFHWSTDYRTYWVQNILPKVENLLGYPNMQTFDCLFFQLGKDSCIEQAREIMQLYPDSFLIWHQQARDAANLGTSPDGHNHGYVDRFEPGTERFDSALSAITSKPLSRGGTRLISKSALYHVHGEYKFKPEFMDIVVGGNFRLYVPNSERTIFNEELILDTIKISEDSIRIDTSFTKITNSEFGFYAGIEKKIFNEKLKLNLTARVDKNQNFDYVLSPAASAVYSHNNNHLRLSFSSAVRNPTLADQYLYYNIGRAILIGNIDGFDSLVTVSSLFNFFSDLNPDTLDYFNVDPIRPEKVKSIEIGFRTTLLNRLYIDASYYYSFYRDFIGYKLGVDLEYDSLLKLPTYIQAYRIAANASDVVTTQGFSIGVNYYFKKHYSLSGNYTWNILNTKDSLDPIIPAYNTPEHKFNIGFSGRDINTHIGSLRINNLGFSINYKWVQGFLFEGSPQFTGFVPTYDMLDAQVSKRIPKIYTTFKLGVSNLFGIAPFFSEEAKGMKFKDRMNLAFNNDQFQVYGGPRVGRLIYFSILVELDKR